MRQADLVIWDKVTIQNKHVFKAVDRFLKDIRNNPYLVFKSFLVVFRGN